MKNIKFKQLVQTIIPEGDNSNIQTKEGGRIWHFFGLVDNAWVSPVSLQYPIMQFTGLLDKTGKEIYEGDILKVLETGWENGHNVTVVFDNGGFKTDFMDDPITSQHEVIGNIFENPELLIN